MNCDGVRGLLSAYLDGELSPGELLRVEQHLRRCHGCTEEVDSLRQTIALVASLDEVELPADFHAQLHNRLVALGPPIAPSRRPSAPSAWQRQVRRFALPSVAAAALLAVGVSAYPGVVQLVNRGVEKSPPVVVQNPAPVITPAVPDQQGGSNLPGSGDVGQPDPNKNTTPPADAGGDADVIEPVVDPVAPSKGPNRPTDGPHVVTNPGAERPRTDLAPKNTLSVVATARVASHDRLTEALSAYSPRVDATTVAITVDSAQVPEVVAALQGAAGVELVGEVTTKESNIADQIEDAMLLLEQKEQQVAELDAKLPTLSGHIYQEAVEQLKVLQDEADLAAAGLQRLNDQDGKAFITVHVQVPDR